MIDKEKLVKDYYEKKTDALKIQMIEAYTPLVKIIAGRLSMNMVDYFEYEDLCSFGIFGLIDAITKYTPNLETKFETYANFRIRGAILDEVRKHSSTPRSVIEKKKLIDKAYENLSIQGKDISKLNLSIELGIPLNELSKWEYQIEQSKFVYIDQMFEEQNELPYEVNLTSDVGIPEKEIIDQLSVQELKKILTEELDKLTEKEKKVIFLYYYEELTLKEISLILEVSESRISQLHKNAIKKLKEKMGKYAYLLNCC